MVERRWLLRLVPPMAAVLVFGLAASSIGAADGSWNPPPCEDGRERLVTAARDKPLTPAPGDAWYTLNPRLDGRGILAGQRLRIGRAGAGTRSIALPPESSAAGPFGRIVLVTADDGRHSTIRAVDALARCAWTLGSSADVIRRATIDPAGRHVYEFRVDRRTRADLGVWRRSPDGGAATRVIDALPADATVGPTFSTTFTWSVEGDRLAVQSCGASRCRTRHFDPATGRTRLVADPEQGELVGLGGGRVVYYEPCLGLPCGLHATKLDGGGATTIAPAAGLARVVATEAGPVVVVEAAPGERLDVRRLDGALERSIRLPADSLRLLAVPDRALAGTALPPGWVAVAPDGRSPDEAVLVRLDDGTTAGVDEVLR